MLGPDRTVSRMRSSGCKRSKDRITVLVCANSDGSEKIESMLIRISLKLWAYQKKLDLSLN